MSITPGARKLYPHTLPPPSGLVPLERVLDIGAGLRPMQWYAPRIHAVVEPHTPYADVLEASEIPTRPAVFRCTALQYFRRPPDLLVPHVWDAIYLLDVLEHMTRDEGAEVLWHAVHRARVQVVVYTPQGFVEQTRDVWGLGGDEWQTHRSGWTPADFPAPWRTEIANVQDPGFFAVWTRGTK